MDEYIKLLNDELESLHELKEEMRAYALANDVPIIRRESLDLINTILKIKKPKRMLEIGTAIGYSAICFSDNVDEIISLERDEEMYKIALDNINKAGLDHKIKVIFGDALEIDETSLGLFDVIFIDAAKAQYIKFFDKFTPLLNPNGIVISDNILFHGCVENQENLSRNLRSMVRKIDSFNKYLKDNKAYATTFFEFGDGLAISIKE